ncbi:MAG: glycosyltransferase family 4 protein [Saprospiraceae bacterium]|nr:glycosyltransferase family 4 protein [Saprospiraceae bacterium]
MKVLFVLENYYPKIGGVETLFKQLVDELAKEKDNQVFVVTTAAGAASRKEVVNGNIHIYRLRIWNRYLFTLLALWPILNLARHCDFVHTTSYNAALPAFIGAKFWRKPIFITFHEAWGKLWFQLPFLSSVGRYGHYYFEKLLLRLPFDKFIAVSQATAGQLSRYGVPSGRIAMIYNGLDYQDFKRVEPLERQASLKEKFIYTFFGRLGISKGLDLLLPAAAKFKSKYPESRLILIIPEEPKSMYKRILKLIKTFDLQGHIIIKKQLTFEALKRQLVTSDAVVVPSYSEGFCFAAAECIALGVPIISSDQAALKEVVSGQHIKMRQHSVLGVVEALVSARLGNWQHEEVQQFHLFKTIQQYMNLYAEYAFLAKQSVHRNSVNL